MEDQEPSYTFGRQKWAPVLMLLLSLVGLAWACRHVYVLTGVFERRITGRSADFAVVWAIAFVLFAVQIVMAWMERPYTVTPRKWRKLAEAKITVNVPLYNEDPELVYRCVRSVFNQTHLPTRLEVVDDGSDKYDYTELKARCYKLARRYPSVQFSWVRKVNGGKRKAQLVTFRDDDSEYAVTLDSDSILDKRAIEEGLKPFADPQVMSVAGLYLGLNANDNLVTRIGELICVSWQLVGRSALSTAKSVIVNSGAFAMYRTSVIRNNADVYENEMFGGKHMPYSDDAHLAMLSRMVGKTVQQPTAACFTLYPTSLRVYCKQYTRWMRGAFIRAWWRLRYLPLTNFAFWNEFFSWFQFVVANVVFLTLYFWWPYVDHRLYIWSIVIPLVLGYVVCARYLMVERTDLKRRTSWYIFSLAPLMIVWSWVICRPIRIYAMLTFNKRVWGTRGATTSIPNNIDPDATVEVPRVA